MIDRYVFLISMMLNVFTAFGIDLYFCTAATSSYYPHVVNLIGSIHKTNFKHLKRIAVYDLGLTKNERAHLNSMQRVTVYDLDQTYHKDLLTYPKPKGIIGWYAWKYVAMRQCLEKYPYILWIDAGSTVLKPLDHLFEYIAANGYFIGTIGNEMIDGKWRHPISWGTTRFVADAFQLNTSENSWILDQEFVMGNIQGVSRQATAAYLDNMYELAKDLTYFQDDGTTPHGFGTGRHDQTLLSILAYMKNLHIFKQDYTQTIPMELPLSDGTIHPLCITWNKDFVCNKTHIYSSRGDIQKLKYYKKKIHYKNNVRK